MDLHLNKFCELCKPHRSTMHTLGTIKLIADKTLKLKMLKSWGNNMREFMSPLLC